MGLLTTDGIVIEANRAALSIIDTNLSDVIGKPFWETPWWEHFPEQHPVLKQAIARAASGEFVRLETKHIWANKTLAFVDFSLKPMLDETGTVIMLIPEGRDITDRKLAEQKIHEQAALLDIASDAIFVRDLNHQILYWNQGAERLYGWSVAEVIGQKANQLLQEDDSPGARILKTLFDAGEWQGELRTVTKTGQEVIVAGRWTLVRNDAGQPRFILTVNTNITEKKRLESQFYQAQRLESLGTLASGIAHDLNNVLTPILAISQLLRLQHLNLDTRSQEMLSVLEHSAKRGARMVKRILTFTRGTDEERITLQIAPLLQEVINVMQQTFPKAIAIHHNSPEQPLWRVSADPTHLYQVFMNLCINARDAMPNGGTLMLSANNCFVDEILAQMHLDAQVGNYVVVTITDTGTGIPAEVRDFIFDPFFTTKAPGMGTGLGLSTSLGIVKSYGGFMQVSSQVKQGTQIQVYLPATEAPLTQIKPGSEMVSNNGELLLIVNDSAALPSCNQLLLEEHN